jgi:hypothetical protein
MPERPPCVHATGQWLDFCSSLASVPDVGGGFESKIYICPEEIGCL